MAGGGGSCRDGGKRPARAYTAMGALLAVLLILNAYTHKR
jgi:hypothetical protein